MALPNVINLTPCNPRSGVDPAWGSSEHDEPWAITTCDTIPPLVHALQTGDLFPDAANAAISSQLKKPAGARAAGRENQGTGATLERINAEPLQVRGVAAEKQFAAVITPCRFHDRHAHGGASRGVEGDCDQLFRSPIAVQVGFQAGDRIQGQILGVGDQAVADGRVPGDEIFIRSGWGLRRGGPRGRDQKEAKQYRQESTRHRPPPVQNIISDWSI
jgi:hypothetical protein